MYTLVNFVTGVLAGALVLSLLSSLLYLAEQAVKDFNKPFHLEGSDNVDNPHTPDSA